MSSLRKALICFTLAMLSISAAFAEGTISISEKALLQASMQKHIDRQLVNGAYLQLKLETGEVRELYPVTAHPMILQMDQYFVLCSSFLDNKGNNVNIDFYLARSAQTFIVFQTVIDDRKPLERLIKSGRASRVS